MPDAGEEVRIVPVVMSGGSGTRLWPLSTNASPKQFHALASENSMIQETALRFHEEGLEGGAFLPPIVISNVRHGEMVRAQFQAVGVPLSAVVLEATGRNTAPVAVVAAALAQRLHPGALVLLLPADHVISDAAGFRAAAINAAAAAADHIVTFGITPDGPETGYGYIQAGAAIAPGVAAVKRFVEKPDRATAQRYLDEGGYAWNAGIFLFSPATMLQEMRAARPDIADAALAALDASPMTDGVIALDPVAFGGCASESIDVAVMEKTALAAVAPMDVGWADVGSWSELWRLGAQDAAGNHARGRTVLLDAADTLVWAADGLTVAAVGVHDLVIVATGTSVLVLPRDRAQDVKKVVEELKARGVDV